MKKTMYIPKGQEMLLESLTCDRIVADGRLRVTGDIRAKHISGRGFIFANVIAAESVTANTIDAGSIVADRLIAARVFAVEVHAVRSMAVSSFIRAGYVKTGRLTVAEAEIEDLHADEVVKLSAKRRGLLGTLFASFIRSKWTALTCRERKTKISSANIETGAAEENPDETQSSDMSPELSEAMSLMSDPEFLRLKAMYMLTQETGHIWQLIPKTEPTNRAVTAVIKRPAA